MPPKKDVEASDLITGFSDKECKLLAAAFISCTGPDKYDYDLMAALTKNTAGSLKKMWPPVKKKAVEAHASFGTFLGQPSTAVANGESKTPAPKAASGKKRKVTDENMVENDVDPNSDGGKSDGNKLDNKKAKAPAAKGRGRPKKVPKVKKESTSGDEAENSADGGDGLGQDNAGEA